MSTVPPNLYKSAVKLRVLILTVMSLLLSATTLAAPPPGGMMGGHMMNNEEMQKYMQENGYGYGRGYGGMMGGYGPMMGGYGGMMGGYGPMMGGYGGMMGGYGGMMGGYGGMMGMGGMMGGFYGLNLSKDQRDKIRRIRHDMRKENLSLMSKMMDSWDNLSELFDNPKPDPAKVGKAYDQIAKIRRDMLEQHLKTRNKIYDLLNQDQRKELESNRLFGYGHMGGMMQ